ncbi:MAG: PEGA domain-containing protein, partial [Spirochaetaceae bacterium]|nr:PEGA domain-containing protein [Spirochaetaceae bacterium]
MINRLRFIVLPAFLILQILLPRTLNAESFPSPGHQSTISLLGIPTRISADSADLKVINITIEGPRRLKLPVGTNDWDIRWFRVTPGSYSVYIDEGNIAAVIEVPPETIMVAPIRLVISSDGAARYIFVEPVDEEDRQKAALNLGLYYDFPEWYGRKYLGFGSLRPTVEQERKLFTATLTTNPSEAEVYLDDRLVGSTPLELNLTGSKHKLLFRAEGREDITRYIKLERDADIVIEMPITIEQSAGRETYRTIVGPFFPKGEADEQLANLFADTLQITLEEDERLNVVREEIIWNDELGITSPNYSTIEKSGADLIVSGFFQKEGNELTVLANLYDIQAESSKASFTWSGTIGLSIFDAMDEISASFMEAVDHYLPDAGRILETRTEVLYEDTSQAEYEYFRNSLVRNRWRDSRHSFSLFLGLGGGMEELVVDNGTSQFNLIRSQGTPLFLTLDWTYDFNRYLA